MLATLAREVPDGPRWAHEVKHDGFRFICRRDGDRVRIFSRNALDWTHQLSDAHLAVTRAPVAATFPPVIGCGRMRRSTAVEQHANPIAIQMLGRLRGLVRVPGGRRER